VAEIVSLTEGVRELVSDGDVVALEGFTHLIPHAAGHEIVRQGLRRLTLVRMTPDVIYDAATGWELAVATDLAETAPPSEGELGALRALAAA
jgi:glutaconate CoA-transferase subunit A